MDMSSAQESRKRNGQERKQERAAVRIAACDICKTEPFSSEDRHAQHMNSKKHKQLAAQHDKQMEETRQFIAEKCSEQQRQPTDVYEAASAMVLIKYRGFLLPETLDALRARLSYAPRADYEKYLRINHNMLNSEVEEARDDIFYRIAQAKQSNYSRDDKLLLFERILHHQMSSVYSKFPELLISNLACICGPDMCRVESLFRYLRSGFKFYDLLEFSMFGRALDIIQESALAEPPEPLQQRVKLSSEDNSLYEQAISIAIANMHRKHNSVFPESSDDEGDIAYEEPVDAGEDNVDLDDIDDAMRQLWSVRYR